MHTPTFFRIYLPAVLFICLAIIGFVFYNIYLVDHSYINLKLAVDSLKDLQGINAGEVSKIATLVHKALRQEVTRKDFDATNVISLEMSSLLIDNLKDVEQLKDINFLLQKVISRKEVGRSGFRVALDKTSRTLAPAPREASLNLLKNKEKDLLEKVQKVKEIEELQNIYNELSVVYILLEDLKKSEQYASEIVKLDPKTYQAARGGFILAWNLKARGKYGEAERKFDEIVKNFSELEFAKVSLFQKADIQSKQGNYEGAVQTFNEVSQKYPDTEFSRAAHYISGELYKYVLEDNEKAEQTFKKVVQSSPESDFAQQVARHNLPAVAGDFRNIGFRHLYASQYDLAWLNFLKALEINPHDGRAYIGQALCLFWQGKSDEALKKMREAIQSSPQDIVVSINAGYIMASLGLINEALEEYRRLTSFHLYSADLYYNLGTLYLLQGRSHEAEKNFSKAVGLRPDFSLAYNNLGCALWEKGKWSEASVEFVRAIELNPSYKDAHYNLGIVYKSQGLYDQAAKEFKKVLDLDPEYPKAARQLRESQKYVTK